MDLVVGIAGVLVVVVLIAFSFELSQAQWRRGEREGGPVTPGHSQVQAGTVRGGAEVVRSTGPFGRSRACRPRVGRTLHRRDGGLTDRTGRSGRHMSGGRPWK